MSRVDDLMRQTFSRPRDPRSDAYKAGVRAVLAFRLEGTRVELPYAPGSAEADAFCSGCEEGHRVWRRQQAGEVL